MARPGSRTLAPRVRGHFLGSGVPRLRPLSYIGGLCTRERTAAKKLAAEYFERFPKARYQTESRELAPSAIAEYRIYDEAAA
jgi:hypothetical protein